MSARDMTQTSSTVPTGTEQQDPRYGDSGLWPATSVLDTLAEAQMTAGGTTALFETVEGAEDREDNAIKEILSHSPGPNDVVFGIAASGATPYTCAAITTARTAGALTVGISCTGAEAIAGSTRLKAGTAQKAVLNMLSTTLMIKLGHGYRGQMVDMRVVNAKLGKRAARMVHDLAGGTSAEIEAALLTSHQNVKRAILISSRLTAEDAATALTQYAGDLSALMVTLTDQG